VASKFAKNFLERMKISLTAAEIGSKNMAAVMLTATLAIGFALGMLVSLGMRRGARASETTLKE